MDKPREGLAPIFIEGVWEAIGKPRAEGLSILLVEQNASCPSSWSTVCKC
jgi:branched-chain amino acid transport system ATP-binding protein